MRHDLRLALVTSLLLINSYTSAVNSIPKFPSTSPPAGNKDQSLANKPRTVQTSEDAEQPSNKSSVGHLTNLFSKKSKKRQDALREGTSSTGQDDSSSVNQASSTETPTKEADAHSSESSPGTPGVVSSVSENAQTKPVDDTKKEEPKPAENQQDKVKPVTSTPPPRSKTLDIVIAHFAPENTKEMLEYWLKFLEMPKVQALNPYVYIYCQNEKVFMTEEHFKPILKYGGEVVHTSNIGRESHAYLEHIISRWNDLANHTLFTQDIAVPEIPIRFEMLFEHRTGFLPLSGLGHQICDDPWIPKGVLTQIYSMLTEELCPPVGFTANFLGQFVVSKRRILDRNYWTYKRLMDYLSKESDHWIHETHGVAHLKQKSNPMFGHVLERSWTLAFNCFESWRNANCWDCLVKGMVDCKDGDCQCFDRNVV